LHALKKFLSNTKKQTHFHFLDLPLTEKPPRKYPYFGIVVGLVWSHDPKRYAGGSLPTGRASHARKVKGDDPDKKGYPSPPGWGLGMRLKTPPHKKYIITKPQGNEAGQILWH
jgi:hypothetical protein